jgi:hypothetical protein
MPLLRRRDNNEVIFGISSNLSTTSFRIVTLYSVNGILKQIITALYHTVHKKAELQMLLKYKKGKMQGMYPALTKNDHIYTKNVCNVVISGRNRTRTCDLILVRGNHANITIFAKNVLIPCVFIT